MRPKRSFLWFYIHSITYQAQIIISIPTTIKFRIKYCTLNNEVLALSEPKGRVEAAIPPWEFGNIHHSTLSILNSSRSSEPAMRNISIR